MPCITGIFIVWLTNAFVIHLYSIARARDIYSDIKNSKGRELSPRGRLQDVLLQAIHSSQNIIETRLNGVSFCQEYVALGHLIQSIESCKESVEQLKTGAYKVHTLTPSHVCVHTKVFYNKHFPSILWKHLPIFILLGAILHYYASIGIMSCIVWILKTVQV